MLWPNHLSFLVIVSYHANSCFRVEAPHRLVLGVSISAGSCGFVVVGLCFFVFMVGGGVYFLNWVGAEGRGRIVRVDH